MWSYTGKRFFLGVCAAYVAIVLALPQPPLLSDYPDWIYQGVLLAKTLTGHPVAGYALKAYPVPNSLSTVGLGLLTLLCGWKIAAKLWLVLYIVFASITSLYAAKVFEVEESLLWWVLPGTVFFGSQYWLGTINFSIGVCLLLLMACRLFRRQEDAPGLVALLLACFFTHMMIYGSAMVLVLLYCLKLRRWRLFWAGLGTSPLAVWYFMAKAHGHEKTYTHNSILHALPAGLILCALLLAAYFRPQFSIRRGVGYLLSFLTLVLGVCVCASILISVAPRQMKALPGSSMLALKALQPAGLFGFVDIVDLTHFPAAASSSTLALLGKLLFFVAIYMSIATGLVLVVSLGKRLLARREQRDDHVATEALWDFVALFALLYFVSPPNVLDVIGVDMRVAGLALMAGLYLLARENGRWLRYAVIPCVFLTILNLYQFAALQYKGTIPNTGANLPPALTDFGAVNPYVRSHMYDAIVREDFHETIFTTGMFVETLPESRPGSPE